jgi:hypothetical protein
MAKLKTTICKLSKAEIQQSLELIAREVLTARYLCRKCGRAAHHKGLLCKPVSIPEVTVVPEAD